MESSVRNKDGSYKELSNEIAQETSEFMKVMLDKHRYKLHPDDIGQIVNTAIFTCVCFEVALHSIKEND